MASEQAYFPALGDVQDLQAASSSSRSKSPSRKPPRAKSADKIGCRPAGRRRKYGNDFEKQQAKKQRDKVHGKHRTEEQHRLKTLESFVADLVYAHVPETHDDTSRTGAVRRTLQEAALKDIGGTVAAPFVAISRLQTMADARSSNVSPASSGSGASSSQEIVRRNSLMVPSSSADVAAVLLESDLLLNKHMLDPCSEDGAAQIHFKNAFHRDYLAALKLMSDVGGSDQESLRMIRQQLQRDPNSITGLLQTLNYLQSRASQVLHVICPTPSKMHYHFDCPTCTEIMCSNVPPDYMAQLMKQHLQGFYANDHLALLAVSLLPHLGSPRCRPLLPQGVSTGTLTAPEGFRFHFGLLGKQRLNSLSKTYELPNEVNVIAISETVCSAADDKSTGNEFSQIPNFEFLFARCPNERFARNSLFCFTGSLNAFVSLTWCLYSGGYINEGTLWYFLELRSGDSNGNNIFHHLRLCHGPAGPRQPIFPCRIRMVFRLWLRHVGKGVYDPQYGSFVAEVQRALGISKRYLGQLTVARQPADQRIDHAGLFDDPQTWNNYKFIRLVNCGISSLDMELFRTAFFGRAEVPRGQRCLQILNLSHNNLSTLTPGDILRSFRPGVPESSLTLDSCELQHEMVFALVQHLCCQVGATLKTLSVNGNPNLLILAANPHFWNALACSSLEYFSMKDCGLSTSHKKFVSDWSFATNQSANNTGVQIFVSESSQESILCTGILIYRHVDRGDIPRCSQIIRNLDIVL